MATSETRGGPGRPQHVRNLKPRQNRAWCNCRVPASPVTPATVANLEADRCRASIACRGSLCGSDSFDLDCAFQMARTREVERQLHAEPRFGC